VQRFVKLAYSALLRRVVFLWLISRCLIEWSLVCLESFCFELGAFAWLGSSGLIE
jgi:hypothetical protein